MSLIKYLGVRFGLFGVLLFMLSIGTFFLLRIASGDPALSYLNLAGIPPTDEAVAHIREVLGLNRPLWEQYAEWFKGAMVLDFGRSWVTDNPVIRDILYFLPATMELALYAMAFTLLLGFPLGCLCAFYRESLFDRIVRTYAQIAASMPNFWVGFLLMYLLSLKLDLLPPIGRGEAAHLIMPVLALSLHGIAVLIRFTRASVLEHLHSRYALYARSRGIGEFRVVGVHVLGNAVLPILNGLGVSFGHMLGGTVIVENVFAWPGLGHFALGAISSRDFPVIQCYLLVMAVVFVMVNFLVDMLEASLDPRLREKPL